MDKQEPMAQDHIRGVTKKVEREWVGLTDADKEVLLANLYESVEGLITAIEAKLKEKNT